MPMKVVVDQDKCVSSGHCVLNAAGVFDQRDEDGVVILLDEHPTRRQGRKRSSCGRGLPRAGHLHRGMRITECLTR